VGTDCCVYWELQVLPLLLFVFRYVFPSVYSKLLYYVLIKGCVYVTASTVASTYDSGYGTMNVRRTDICRFF
jgi:hypothetical protein